LELLRDPHSLYFIFDKLFSGLLEGLLDLTAAKGTGALVGYTLLHKQFGKKMALASRSSALRAAID
jgi:hypothetical protein